MNGKLIVIEGVDGSGKRTQTNLLASKLRSAGYEVISYCFPDYEGSVVGPLIGRMLAGKYGDSTKFHPEMIAPLFALDRAEKSSAIKIDLASGRIVICDRYVYSNVAHQSSRLPVSDRDGFKRWVERLEFDVLSMPRPDITILLDVENNVSIERRLARVLESSQQRPLDEYERDTQSLADTREIYLALAAQESWELIGLGGDASIEDVHQMVMEKVYALLGLALKM